MLKRTIEARLDPKNVNGNTRGIKVAIDYPSNIAEAIKLFGEGVVFEKFTDAHDVAFQAFLRTQLGKSGDKKMADAAILKAASEWKPMSRKAADPAKKVETIKNAFKGMAPSDRAALIKQLQASLKE